MTMRTIDYSVPNKQKDVTPQFSVGDYVEGDCLYLDRGQIEDIQMSTGERKGLIYKIGLNWYFYNFIKPWYDGMIASAIGKSIEYNPEHKITFTHNKVKYTIKGVIFNLMLNHCYLLVDKREGTHKITEDYYGIGLYQLTIPQKRKIFYEVFWDVYGKPYDQNGRTIHKGNKVIWNDPETGDRTEYEVYDYPTEDMVKLWNEYGECEALPEECEVVK